MLIKKKHIGNRFVSVMLSLAILAETLFSAGISLMKVHAESSEFTASDTVSQNGIAITTKKTLSYIGNNTYKLVLDATSSIKEAYETSIRTSTEDGVFTVPEGGAGYYLLELWGGTGGYGSDIPHITDILNLTIETYPGGHGGQSGYTYGYIYLNEGDSLVYNIGTKGANVVITEGAGGGESGSGSGGGAGEYGLYSVGAGGGFSAIYKFSASDHHTTGATVTESERLSKYIMIAGGGGGGGAANALEYRQTGRADGGRGGIAGISSSGKLTAENNNGVSGTYFVGSNGSSSGSEGLGSTSKTDYVGIGGTDRPGELKRK